MAGEAPLRCAIGLPNVGEFGDPRVLAELAVAAEEYGWHGVFVWDHVLYHQPEWPVANPTVALAAIAARTSRIRFGALMTALPRRRVQTVARETVSLDVLSDGRLVVGAALGSMDSEYAAFGEPADLRHRAVRLDESLAALTALWSAEPATYQGDTVTVDDVTMVPGPVQRPRIPIWCAGRWPVRAGFRRAARWDGVLPTHMTYGRGRTMPPAELADIVAFIAAERRGHGHDLAGFDVALEGRTDPTTARQTVERYAEVGMTWWVEAMGWWRGGVAEARKRVAAGPPVS